MTKLMAAVLVALTLGVASAWTVVETVFLLNFSNGNPYLWRFKRYFVTGVRVQETRADWCFRGGYVCAPLPPP